jgi:hypothetical protein
MLPIKSLVAEVSSTDLKVAVIAGLPTPMRIATIAMTAKTSMRVKPPLRVFDRLQEGATKWARSKEGVEVFMAGD